MNTVTMLFPWLIPPCFPLWFTPLLFCTINYLFCLLGDPFSCDRVANVHPLLSLANSQLFTPCCLTHPGDTHGSSYVFTLTTSKHQLLCLIQLTLSAFQKVNALKSQSHQWQPLFNFPAEYRKLQTLLLINIFMKTIGMRLTS